MNDTIFSNSFHFRTLRFNRFHYTDNRKGAPEHYFAYMLRGRCRITTDTYSVEINEGDFFYIPENCAYQSHWYGDPEIEFVSLGFGYFPNFENRTYPSQVIPYDEASAEMFLSLTDTVRLCANDIGVFYTLTARLIPNMVHTSVCRSREIVEQTKNYLLTHPFAKNSELAKNCAVSEAALYAAFQKSSDLTPNHLRSNMLLEKAKDLLISTDKPIEYISDTLGYSSASYFRKKFKDYFSLTPKEMRSRHRI